MTTTKALNRIGTQIVQVCSATPFQRHWYNSTLGVSTSEYRTGLADDIESAWKATVFRSFLFLILCSGTLVACNAEPAIADTIATIRGTEKQFDSLQAAIDAASAGSTIDLRAGRIDERVRVTKSLTLIGAGTDSTILGPTAEAQLELSNRFEEHALRVDAIMRTAEESQPRREPTADEAKELREQYENCTLVWTNLSTPIVSIEGKSEVTLRSLRVTMPLTPRKSSGLRDATAIKLHDASLSLRDVAIIGCMYDGIVVSGNARLDVRDCLITACWGPAVSASHPNTASVHLQNSDFRNNYHYNISLGVDTCVIEDCRISGTPWSGISTSARIARIERNVIFHNNRAIYSVGDNAIVRHNLFYDNGVGASCWEIEKPTYESNIFYKNKLGGIFVAGPAEPIVQKNAFVDCPQGINYRPINTVQRNFPYAERYHVEQNLFWQIESPLSVTKSVEPNAQAESAELPKTNQLVDPEIKFVDGTLKLGNAQRSRELGIEALNGMTLSSRWPITPEETAIIPDAGQLDSNLWKKRPKREPQAARD